jgi:hypothetical protein
VLLQRDAKERRSPDARAHDPQELRDVDALLDVVGQVEVRVVEGVVWNGRLGRLPVKGCQRGEHQDEDQPCRSE